MKPLLFANWRSINRMFCTAMWMLALLLATVILLRSVDASAQCTSRAIAPAATASGTTAAATECSGSGLQARLPGH